MSKQRIADMLHDACEETRAKRRLEDAAPDLLEALKECIIAFHGWPISALDCHDPVERLALEQARDAIAKAEGRS